MIKLFLIFLLFSIFYYSYSQSTQRWKRMRYEMLYGFGATNTLTDLGGADQIGTNFVRDLELSMTRVMGSIGLRYRITYSISTKAFLSYGFIQGDDKLTKEQCRNYRNLSFRTTIFEFSNVYEFSIIQEKEGHRYNLRRVRGLKGLKLHTYYFLGWGFFYYNPKAKYKGKWYALQPLGTEGQGILESREKYSRIGFCLPWGIGVNYALNRRLSIGLELCVRKTFTDYIDDVSTTYIDKEFIRESKGEIAAYFADPSDGTHPNWTAPGQQRGDPKDKDVYMSLSLLLSYRLYSTKGGLPKFRY